MMLPSPNELFARFERGEIERDELHAMMAVHARELIAEMEEDHLNPAAAWLESVLARRMMARLVRRHGSHLMREILVALAAAPDFPPARYLWNAAHPDVPLHCYLRMRREPVLRIAAVNLLENDRIAVLVEHGEAGRGRATRRRLSLRRDERWSLAVEPAAPADDGR